MTTIKNAPATPLPWDLSHDSAQDNPYWHKAALHYGSAGVAEMQAHNAHSQGHRNAAYIAHAANAYPKLVDALRMIVDARDVVKVSVQHFHKNRAEVKSDSDAAANARALLRALGEQS